VAEVFLRSRKARQKSPYVPAYSDTGAVQATPNNGTNNNTGYVINSPRLDSAINFVKTGGNASLS